MAGENVCDTELPLPKGWIKSVSKKFDKPYWYHERTKCSIWVHPALLQEDGEKNRVKTTASGKGKKDGSTPTSNSSTKKKASPSSSVMGFLGLQGGRSHTHKDDNPVRKSRSISPLMPCSSAMSSTTENRVRERSPIEYINQECEQKGFGQRKSSSSSTPEKQFMDALAMHNHQSQKFQSIRDKTDSDAVASMTNNDIEGKFMKPKLKPLAPMYKTEFKQNRKRRSSECSDISNKIESRSKILKTNCEDGKGKSSAVEINVLTPAMKAIMAKRESRTASTCTKRSQQKSPRNETMGNEAKGYLLEVPTPAMIKVSKKKDLNKNMDTQEKAKATEDESDDGTSKSIVKKKIKKKSKIKTIQTNDPGIISSIMDSNFINKCSSFIASLNPLKSTGVTHDELNISQSSPTKDIQNSNSFVPTKHADLDIDFKKCNDVKTTLKPLKPICTKPDMRYNKSKLSPSLNRIKDVHNSNSPQRVDFNIANIASNKSKEVKTTLKALKPIGSKTGMPCIASKLSQNIAPMKGIESGDLFTQKRPVYFDDVEDMEVDDPVTVKITKDIQELREHNVFQKPEVNAGVQKQDLPVYSDSLYIILDTNVLLSDLEFTSELKDYPIPVVGAPNLVIPWMVFQELDSLKDAVKRFHKKTNEAGIEENTQTLSTLARKAIRFIGDCLDGEHPRIKGQSAVEAATPIAGFTEENNDDSIIHCALCLKLQSVRSNVVVLSNDRNLCNKAIIFGVKAFSQKGIIPGLKKLFGASIEKVELKNDSSEVHNNSAMEKRVDAISCEFQCILRDNFTKIIETEMISAYGEDLWLEIVKIKPPWTLGDIFILLEKHWIAVFGHIMGRHHDKTVNTLKEMYLILKTCIPGLDSMKTILQLSSTILKSCQANSSYNSKVRESIQCIDMLVKKCDNLNDQKDTLENKQFPSNVKSEAGTSERELTSYEKVRLTFDDVWNTATRYSALVFASLNFPSPLVKDLDPDQEFPSSEESLGCLSVMTPCIFNLKQGIHSILDPSTDKQQSIINLFHSICTFSRDVMKHECAIYLDDLVEFCQDGNTKDVFIQGLSQLDRLYATLQQCGEFYK